MDADKIIYYDGEYDVDECIPCHLCEKLTPEKYICIVNLPGDRYFYCEECYNGFI